MLAAESLPKETKSINLISVTIDTEQCKGCGLCAAFCPEKILHLGEQLNSYGYPVVEMTDITACKGCLRCSLMCPDVVFTFSREEHRQCKK